jgi:hypothetical protein
VNRRRTGPVALLIPLSLVLGCTSALKEPPPMTELGVGSGGTSGSGRSVAQLITEAGLLIDSGADAASVARARGMFLEAARRDEAPVEAFLGAARATAWLVEHTDDGARRKDLVAEGVQIGQWCRRLYPEVAECRYRLALAVGQQARERASTAVDGLDVMVELLEGVIADAPDLDFAGGHRVLALVLLRAPGWPTGPGDPELALEHARAAAAAFPDHPPNQLVLGEALAENGFGAESRRALELGIELARVHSGPDAQEWVEQGEAALAGLR